MTRVIADFVFDNGQTLFAFSMLLLLLGSVVGMFIWDRRASIRKYLEHRREVRIQRGLEMGRKQKADRQAYVDGVLGEIITNGVEEAWWAGKLSDEEKSRCYRKVAACGVPDMLPQRSQEQLKAAIKGRRYRGIGMSASPAQEHPAWGENPKPKDDQPSPEVNVINAKKRFGEKALSRLKIA